MNATCRLLSLSALIFLSGSVCLAKDAQSASTVLPHKLAQLAQNAVPMPIDPPEPGNRQLELEAPKGPIVPGDAQHDGALEPFDSEIPSVGPTLSSKGPERAGLLNALIEKGPSESNDPAVLEKMEKTEFGIVTDRDGPSKGWVVKPVVVVPNLPGVQYMWKLKTNFKTPVFLREEFILPEAPSTWKVRSSSAQLVDGGRECVLESFQPVDDGWVGHAWTVSPGDPPGLYEIRIRLNGKLAHTFSFNVGESKEKDDHRDW